MTNPCKLILSASYAPSVMKQLGILDTAFVNLEQGNTPQHIGGLGLYDPSTAPDGFVRFKQVIARTEQRLDRLPLFRTRLVQVPGGLDRPYWVKDAHFDVEFHLRHIALPQPGDWRQLCIQVARLHSRPLDMSRPLWEAYIIEGLDNIPHLPKGCFAVYTKMHHSLVDGAGGAAFLSALHDLKADPGEETLADAEPRAVDLEPSLSELLTRASVNSLRNGFALARNSLQVSRDLGQYAWEVIRERSSLPAEAPRTRFNHRTGPHRVFEAAEIELQAFKAITRATGTKVNDVAMTVVGGALSRYLAANNEAPMASLTASMPLNLRERRGASEENNNLGALFASLHTDIEDPLVRLQACHDSANEAKALGEHNPLVDSMKLAGVFSPAITRSVAAFWGRNNLSRHLPMNVSTVISNVTGPEFPLFCAGARMVDYYGLGLLTPAMGIFHLVFSYCGKVTLSVLADRDMLPDPEFYRECLVAEFNELQKAVKKAQRKAAKAR